MVGIVQAASVLHPSFCSFGDLAEFLLTVDRPQASLLHLAMANQIINQDKQYDLPLPLPWTAKAQARLSQIYSISTS